MENYKRETVLVDENVQWAIIKQSLQHWLFHSLATVLLLALLQVLLGGIFKSWSEHWQTIWPLAASVYVSLIVLLPKFIRDSLELSHRFAGPVLRLRHILRSLAEGKPYTPVKFRESDFWADMAEELNAAVEMLTQQRLRGESPSTDAPAEWEAPVF
jgi:hypothetical protein